METGSPADVCAARGVFSPLMTGAAGPKLPPPCHHHFGGTAGRLCLRAHLLSLVNGDDSGAMEGGGGKFLSPPQDAVRPQRRNGSGALKLES